MKAAIRLIILCFILFGPTHVNAQLDKYIESERVRIKKSEAVEREVRAYIARNNSLYQLEQSLIDDLVTKWRNEDIDESVIKAQLQYRKEQELRQKFFAENPTAETFFAATQIPEALRQQCINGDFENLGVNYTFSSNIGNITECSTQAATVPTVLQVNDWTAMATIISDLEPNYLASDPTLLARGINIPTLSPNGGHTAVKLNNSGVNVNGVINYTSGLGNNDVSTMRRTMTITDPLLEYEFSLILQTSGHLHTQQEPIFRVRIIDSAGIVVQERCVIAAPNCIFNLSVFGNEPSSENILYTNWRCDVIDVSDLIDQVVTLEFSIMDCDQGGHFGTVYIDNICNYTCNTPVFGLMQLDPIENTCPDVNESIPVNLQGNFIPPINSTLTNLSVAFSVNGWTFTSIPNASAPWSVVGNNFSISVDPAALGAIQPHYYTFQVTATFTQTCTDGQFQATNSVSGVVTFIGCCLNDLSSSNYITTEINEQRASWIRSKDIFDNPAPEGPGIYHAGHFILLEPGFETKTSAQFTAYIEGCSDWYEYRGPKQKDINALVERESLKLNLVKVESDLLVLPNPATNVITITHSNQPMKNIRVFNITGQLMTVRALNEEQSLFDISMLADGIYLITGETSSGTTAEAKFIKN